MNGMAAGGSFIVPVIHSARIKGHPSFAPSPTLPPTPPPPPFCYSEDAQGFSGAFVSLGVPWGSLGSVGKRWGVLGVLEGLGEP